jgi:uncharacterized protein YjbI with pentapeptide repeats
LGWSLSCPQRDFLQEIRLTRPESCKLTALKKIPSAGMLRLIYSRVMENENEIAPVTPEAEAAPDGSAAPQPETDSAESAEEAPQPEPDAPATAETESEAGCPIEMGLVGGPRCGRKLHAAPGGVDEQPVCLMHSKDSNKQSGALFDAFWVEFERILEEAGENEAHFEYFFFPNADLHRRTFKAICRFDGATFTQGAYFGRATFTQNANFSYATFAQDANFWRATFTQGAYFSSAAFTQDADFSGAAFSGAAFRQYADFSWATFTQNADFSKATFTQYADFRGATFTQNADFEGTKFYGTADWRRCKFLDQAEFRHTVFALRNPGEPSAVFSLARFFKPEEIVFEDVDLSRALFLNCDVSEVWFTSSVTWARRKGHRGLAVFEEEILLNPELSKIQEYYGKIDHGAVEQIYHQLQKNYDSRLDYRKANDFHYGEMEMRRLASPTGGRFLRLRHWWHRKLSLLAWYRYASDYGNSYGWPGFWLVVTLLAAMLAFPIPGLEWKQPKPGNAAAPAIVTYVSVWNTQDTWTNNLSKEGKLVIKSGITAIDTATFQRNPEYTPVYPRGRVLGILETLLTSSLFALFLLAMRRQFRR